MAPTANIINTCKPTPFLWNSTIWYLFLWRFNSVVFCCFIFFRNSKLTQFNMTSKNVKDKNTIKQQQSKMLWISEKCSKRTHADICGRTFKRSTKKKHLTNTQITQSYIKENTNQKVLKRFNETKAIICEIKSSAKNVASSIMWEGKSPKKNTKINHISPKKKSTTSDKKICQDSCLSRSIKALPDRQTDREWLKRWLCRLSRDKCEVCALWQDDSTQVTYFAH